MDESRHCHLPSDVHRRAAPGHVRAPAGRDTSVPGHRRDPAGHSPPAGSEGASVATRADALAALTVLKEEGEAPPGSLVLLLADDDGAVVLGVGVDDVPADPPQHERVGMLGPFLRHVAADLDGVGGVLLAVCRDGSADIEGGDLAWHDAFTGAVRVAGLADHGTFVVTPRDVAPVHARLPRSAA